MAGMAGLEPANAGVKVPCLTTWRHPSIRRFSGKKARDWDYLPIPCFLGWVKGLEPSTPGTTIRCSNQLSYTHQIQIGRASCRENNSDTWSERTITGKQRRGKTALV